MLPTLRQRVTDNERGLTLVQLVVATLVIVVIGVIAIKVVATGGKSNLDAHAESNAQKIATRLQTCYAQTASYESCASAGFGTAAVDVYVDIAAPAEGKVAVVAPTASTFSVVANSLSSNYFVISKDLTGRITRSCGPILTPYGIATGSESGGCANGNTW
jgi:Tfp pilus assembly protein PilE